jgi:hypothetical protein
MADTRTSRLRHALTQLQLKWGDQIVAPLSEQTKVVAPTGFARLDDALSGGLPIPSLTFAQGSATSGATTTALQLLARHQRACDSFGAYFDLSGRFDPQLADQAGVDIGRLLLSRPASMASAMSILRDLVRERSGVIIVDTDIHALSLSSEDIQRLTHSLKRSDNLVVVLSSRVFAPTPTLAALQLRFERQSWMTSEGFYVGIRTRVEIVRSPANNAESVEFDIVYGDLV